MKTACGRTSRAEWQRLATYLMEQWTGTRFGSPVTTAIALLEHLRTIEDAGVLPAYGHDGTVVPSVAQLVQRATITRSPV